MHFTKEQVEKFLEIFSESADAIRQMDGCNNLQLLRGVDDHCHFTTISHWDSAEHLENYRSSSLFKSVWGRVKPMFDQKPLAYSLGQVIRH